jgi:hypothetical protein
MMNYLYIAAFCALAFGVSAIVFRWVKTFIAFAFVSPTVSALLLQGIVFLYLGYVDAWAGIAFVTSWLIAFGCAVVYFLVKRTLDKRKKKPGGQ